MTRGRLVKKSERDMLSGMQVDTYPWKDLTVENILLPDNPRKSVVRAKSHPQQELNTKVQKSEDFSKTFGEPTKPFLPQDMTAEFLASQEELRERKRRMQMDEDEAAALELLDITDAAFDDEQQLRAVRDSNDVSARDANANAAASISKSAVRATSGADISDLSKLAAQNNRGFGDGNLNFSDGDNQDANLDARLKEAFENGFTKGRSEGEASGFAKAMSEVEARAPQQTPSETTPLVQTFEEGFEQGVLRGREQAELEVAEKYNQLMTLFTRGLAEIQHLKGELFSTGREIFAEIAQICAERVLRQSVKLRDEALRSVFEAATSQFQTQDELKIEMHPDDIARIESQLAAEQRKRLRLVSNSTLERGDLKIEAHNEVVSLDLHSTVQQLIESLKDELFEPTKKDNSTEKAG